MKIPVRCRCCLAELPEGTPEPAFCETCAASPPGSDEVDRAYREYVDGVLLGELRDDGTPKGWGEA